ncbi:MAG TPA: hypothetical protein ENN67_01795, partial [Firmicutes bacterium]|nr:hypothetical protein [Bacillota bacterium]
MTDKGAADISTAVFLTSLLIFGAYLVVNFTVDDPFISFRYAKNLSQSNGLTYNPGERIEGFSNPAWVLLMTAPIPIAERIHPLAILWFAKFLGLILTIGACLLIASAEKKLFQRRFPTAAFLFAVNPCVWVWSVGALETPLCAFLLALAVYDSVPVNREKKRLWGPIAMGILSITRPEMPILLAVYI